MISLRLSAALLGAAAIAACGLEKNPIQDITAPIGAAQVRFFNYGVNAPGVNFFANDAKITGISTTNCTPPNDPLCLQQGKELASGTAYGASASGGLYSGVTPGQYSFVARIPSTATADANQAVSTVSATLADGKSYSVYVSGIYNTTTKSAESFVVEDPIPTGIDYANALVRLVNASSNAAPLTLYAKNTTTGGEVTVGGATAYKAATTFAPLPAGVYDLTLRAAGSSTAIATSTGVTLSGGRVYTAAVRGDYTSAATATRPTLSVVTNR